MNTNDLVKEIHENAVNHGFWEKEPTFGEVIALCHSELSEALEEYRDERPNIYGTCSISPEHCEHCEHSENCDLKHFNSCKPEGVAVELADCIIRIFDYCGAKGIDIEAVIRAKHEYNKTRPYKHGGKLI